MKMMKKIDEYGEQEVKFAEAPVKSVRELALEMIEDSFLSENMQVAYIGYYDVVADLISMLLHLSQGELQLVSVDLTFENSFEYLLIISHGEIWVEPMRIEDIKDYKVYFANKVYLDQECPDGTIWKNDCSSFEVINSIATSDYEEKISMPFTNTTTGYFFDFEV